MLATWLLLAQLAWAERLAKPGSTHPSFPMDAFAKPTFRLIFDNLHPISNQTALDMLHLYGQGQSAPSSSEQYTGLGEYHTEESNQSQKGSEQSPVTVYLHRGSPSTLHLCSVPRPKAKSGTVLHLDQSSLKNYRSKIVDNALRLLEPLKKNCIYHTMDWFTYSLCYGDAIRQFRALPMAVGGPMLPIMDATQDSYVLGRWNDQIEGFKESETTSTTDLQANSNIESQHQGTDLMELVHFSSLGSSDGDQDEQDDNQLQSQATIEGNGRYISQIWTDGTRCNINNEVRTTEVQFHCSMTPSHDRITVIKEVTTCNYVVVVNTPRLCEEPALAQVEDEVREVRCQPILSDTEIEQSQRVAATIEADNAPPSKATIPKVDLTLAKQHEADAQKEAMQKSRGEVEASIAGIVSRINLAAGDSSNVDLAVKIEWDEDGKFIIAPKIDKSADAQVDADAPKADAKQKGKWEILMEKLIELEDEIYEAADVEEFYLTNSEEGQTAGIVQDGSDKKVKEGGLVKEHMEVITQQATASHADNNAPLRTNQMTREKETFGQKAERFYKAQEAQQQEQQGGELKRKGKESQNVVRERDEL